MFIVLTTAAALSAPVPKATALELKWKFNKGDTVYVTTSSEATSTVNAGGIGGGAIAAQTNVSLSEDVYKLVVTAADEKGATLEITYLTAKSGHVGGGAAANLVDVPNVTGKTVTLTLDKDHKITKVDGADGVRKCGADLLQEDQLRYSVENFLRAVPGKVLGKGDTWNGDHEHPISGGVVIKRSDRGNVVGSEDGLTKLEVISDYQMTSDGKGNQPYTINLKGEKGKQTVLFDGKAGRIRKWTEDYTTSGTLDLGGAGGGGQKITLTMGVKANALQLSTRTASRKGLVGWGG